MLHSEREQITDAAAVYFVIPSQENIDRICQDCKAQLYDKYFFNFITPISRERLEQLAKAAVETNTVSLISKVLSQGKRMGGMAIRLCQCRVWATFGA